MVDHVRFTMHAATSTATAAQKSKKMWLIIFFSESRFFLNILPTPWAANAFFCYCIPCKQGLCYFLYSFLLGIWERYDPSLTPWVGFGGRSSNKPLLHTGVSTTEIPWVPLLFDVLVLHPFHLTWMKMVPYWFIRWPFLRWSPELISGKHYNYILTKYFLGLNR